MTKVTNGTDLPDGVIEIHGRNYNTVAKRITDFRAKHGTQDGWGIVTEFLMKTPEFVYAKATIVDKHGMTIATGHAYEEKANMQSNMADSMIEVAETSAVGRALAFAGFGGQDIASADDMARKAAAPPKMSPKRHREVVESILSFVEADDGLGLLQVVDEMDQEEQLYIWSTLRSWERSAAKKLLAAARDDANKPDPRYVDPTPLPNDRKAKEDKRKANA